MGCGAAPGWREEAEARKVWTCQGIARGIDEVMSGVAKSKEPEVIARAATGEGPTAIARRLGVTQGAVSQTLLREDVRAAVERHNQELLQSIWDERGDGAREAWSVLRAQLHHSDPRIAQRAAIEVLDRTGVTRETVIRVSQTHDVGGRLEGLIRELLEDRERPEPAYSTVIEATADETAPPHPAGGSTQAGEGQGGGDGGV